MPKTPRFDPQTGLPIAPPAQNFDIRTGLPIPPEAPKQDITTGQSGAPVPPAAPTPQVTPAPKFDNRTGQPIPPEAPKQDITTGHPIAAAPQSTTPAPASNLYPQPAGQGYSPAPMPAPAPKYDNRTGQPIMVTPQMAPPQPAPNPYARTVGQMRQAAPEAQETPLPPATARAAGFVPRLAAFAVDHLIVGVIQFGVWLGFGLWDSVFAQPVWFQYTGNALIMAAISAVYFILLTGLCGTTAGKALLQLKVQRTDGGKPGWWTVIYRETVGRFLTGLLCIGYIVLAIDSEHRGFHDMLSDTRVVYRF